MDLLTGSTGFLGRHLARRLAADGRALRALVRRGTDRKRIPPEVSEIAWGGLDDAASLDAALAGIDTVYHLAARVSGGGGREAFRRDNVDGTRNLLEACARVGVRRFVHVSSAGIFGAAAAGSPITEDTPLDPEIEKRGDYAWSKAESDRLVREFRAPGLECVVVRPGILWGAEQPPFFGRLVLPVPGAAGRKVVVGAPDALLPLTHVDNAADGIVLAAERGRAGASYNLVDGTFEQGRYLDLLRRSGAARFEPVYVRPAWFEPVALACEAATRATGRNLPLSRYKLRRATESLRYDTRRAREELGWEPRVGLEEGVATLDAAAPGRPA
ncbi:NAD-dependent epimerase/dehydratase family protein [bacterium]|nr:NAD-dependent epimerase/dehydratase family protein [bacterium]